mmetsp:Transcript_48823/g.122269  ORF Transcript_48823/g.122269 Transcript_48823/m.122269 type:complete len:302 (+) Transcript_48823:78-983(+)
MICTPTIPSSHSSSIIHSRPHEATQPSRQLTFLVLVLMRPPAHHSPQQVIWGVQHIGDIHFIEVPQTADALQPLVEVHHAVDVGTLPIVPPLQHREVALGHEALHQHLEALADPLASLVVCEHRLLYARQCLLPPPLGRLLDLPLHVIGSGALLARKPEDANVVKRVPLDELRELIEVILRLSRKPHHQAGPHRHIGHLGPQLREQALNLTLGRPTPHTAQHSVADVLQRHVEVAAQSPVGCHELDELVVYLVGIDIQESQPVVARLGEESPQKGHQAALLLTAAAGAVSQGCLVGEGELL